MGRNNKKLTTAEFIEKSINKHGNLYDYSKVDYINSHKKINLICPHHGEFFIKPHNHLNLLQGCWKCGIFKRQKSQMKSTEKFIEDAKIKHGSLYDYFNIIYKGIKSKVKIKCNRCNTTFEQTPNAHLNGQGCSICNKNHNKSIFDCKKITKICKSCGIEKDVNDFYKGDGSKRNPKYVYYRGTCKECELKHKVEYRKLESSQKRRREYEKIYNNKRRLIDPAFKLKKDFSSIVRRTLKGDKSGYSLWKYLPYNSVELKSYLESQFDNNMNWNNHGIYWHIDHIQPQCSLKYDSFKHPNFLKCWSLDNLRPLRLTDNLHKSSIFNGINHRGK